MARQLTKLQRIFPTLRIVATVAALCLVGCKREVEAENRAEREANSKKATADSAYDATKPIVDTDFGFRLAAPGPSWKLLREQDAMRINPDASAGALDSATGTYGIVIVERLPGTTLEQALPLIWKDHPGDVIESEQDLEFQGVPAKRRVFTSTVEGQAYRFISTVFHREDHLYQVLSWGSTSKDERPLLAFQDAISLLEGEVVGRQAKREPITHADGVGWRIREGRYESALSGLRLRLPEGWRFVIGDELELLGSDAEIVLVHPDDNTYVSLVVERVAKDRLEPLAGLSRRLYEQTNGAPIEAPFTRKIAGQSVELRRYAQAPFGYLHAIYLGDDALTQFAMWYPLGLSERASAAIDTLLPKVERIPAAERAKLHEELLSAPTSQRRFSGDRAYRAGEFLDFGNGLRWTKPRGFWHIDGFDRALQHSPQTVLFAAEAEVGVYAALEVFDAGTTEAAETLAGLMRDDKLLSRDEVVIDGLTVHRAHTVDEVQSPPMSYAMAVARRNDRMVAMTAWSANDSPESRAAMDAALAGLAYKLDLEPTTTAAGVYTDNHHGFSFAVPAGLGRSKVNDVAYGQVTAWTKGPQELVSMVITNAGGGDEQWSSSFMEQILRDQVGANQMFGSPERSEGTLGAHTTRRLTWKQGRQALIADIVVHDTVIYCVLFGNLSDVQIKTVRDSWALLE